MAGFNFLGDDEEVAPEQPEQTESETNADVDELMTEAERRFTKARYWESKIRSAGFEGDDSQMAQEVANESRAFYRQKMAACLGLGPDAAMPAPPAAVELPFTPEQVQILIGVADRFLKKPTLQKEMLPNAEPVVKKATSPRPAPKAKAPAPVAPQAPAPAAVKKPTAPQKKPTAPAPNPEDTMVIETPTKDGGIMRRSYQKVPDTELGHVWLGENGIRYVLAQNEAGQNYMKSVQRQAKPVGISPIPPLTGDMMMAVAGRHAAKAKNQETPGRPDQPNI